MSFTTVTFSSYCNNYCKHTQFIMTDLSDDVALNKRGRPIRHASHPIESDPIVTHSQHTTLAKQSIQPSSNQYTDGSDDDDDESIDKTGGGSSCHQCKSRRNYVALTYCTSNLDKKNKKCRKKYVYIHVESRL